MDPVSWISAGSSLLNALKPGGAAPAGPATSFLTDQWSMNNSGMAISTGKSTNAATSSAPTTTRSADAQGALAGLDLQTMLLIGLVVWAVIR